MGSDDSEKPGFVTAKRLVEFRAYKVANEWFVDGRSVEELERFFKQQDKRLFVERIRKDGKIIDSISPREMLRIGDEVVLSGRREYTIGEERWIGNEVNDDAILEFPVMVIRTRVAANSRKRTMSFNGKSVGELRAQPFMHGVSIQKIMRMGVNIPISTAPS